MKESDTYFLYVGNAFPHKNLDKAIKAANNLKVNLYIVSKKNKFTDKLKLGEYVKLLGFVSDDELHELYKNSVGFVYPSLSEGFGLPGLEAMKAGTLVLCSYIKVFVEIYLNNAIYFDPNDVKSIMAAMSRVLEMKEGERRKKIEKGKEFVKRYSWEKMARETLGVYNSFK